VADFVSFIELMFKKFDKCDIIKRVQLKSKKRRG
jgi:hypothetical protein